MRKIIGNTVGTTQNPKKITKSYVPETRKIADIDLTADITAKDLQEKLAINQKLDYKVLEPPVSEMTRVYEYLGTLAEENWIGMWSGHVYLSFKETDISGVIKYRQYDIVSSTSNFYIRSRKGTKNEQGQIEWSDWDGGYSNYIPYKELTRDSISALFIQTLTISRKLVNEYYPVVSQAFVKIIAPQTDSNGDVLPVGDYLMVGDIGHDQIGCWSLTDNQSYTIKRFKAEGSSSYNYTVTSSKTALDDKADKSYVDDLFNSIVNGNEVSY